MALDSYTKLLMHMDTSAFPDECGHTVTNNGVKVDTTNKDSGSGSASFNGTNSLFVNNVSDINFGSNDFTIDFWMYNTNYITYEGICCSAAQTSPNWSYYNTGYQIYFSDNTHIILNYTTGGGNASVLLTLPIQQNIWQHIAIVRNNTNIYGFVNGNNVSSKSISSSLLFGTDGKFVIGQHDIRTTYNYYGYIDEFRISNGIARWTNNFTPPTHAYNTCFYLISDNNQYKYFNKTTFLMSNIINNPPTAMDYRNLGNEDLSYLCTSYNQEILQMTNFATLDSGKYGYVDCNDKFLDVKDSTNKTILLMHMNDSTFKDECGHTVGNYNGRVGFTGTAKFGAGSAYFGGSSLSNLSINNSTDFNFKDKNFTIDFWVLLNSNANYQLFGQRSDTSNVCPILIEISTDNTLKVSLSFDNITWSQIITTSSILSLSIWNHIAFVRNGNNFILYLNGISIGQVTSSNKFTDTNKNINIGLEGGNYTYIRGCIDELKISNIARWVNNFTPPTTEGEIFDIGKYLIQDNTTNIIYTYNGTTLIQSPSQNIDSSSFITNGFDDLTVITNIMWTSIFSDITRARILYYTDYNTITENDLTCDINSYRPIDDLQNQFTFSEFKDSN